MPYISASIIIQLMTTVSPTLEQLKKEGEQGRKVMVGIVSTVPFPVMMASVVAASGSEETQSYLPRDVSFISEAIKQRGINVIDVIKALAARGYRTEAQNLLNVVKLRVTGDYLQTSAIVRNGHDCLALH